MYLYVCRSSRQCSARVGISVQSVDENAAFKYESVVRRVDRNYELINNDL